MLTSIMKQQAQNKVESFVLISEVWKLCIIRKQNENLQVELEVEMDMAKKLCQKLTNWKTPRKDGVQDYWVKKLICLKELKDRPMAF